MFKQIKDLDGNEAYLIASLIMFMVFFIIVGIYLIRLSKTHIDIMKEMPLNENQLENHEED